MGKRIEAILYIIKIIAATIGVTLMASLLFGFMRYNGCWFMMVELFNKYLANKCEDLRIVQRSYNEKRSLGWLDKFTHFEGIEFIKERQFLAAGSFKFVEEYSFDNKNTRYAIAIGLNPASATLDSIDKTTYLISHLFYQNQYGGFYLFNKYPDVSKTAIRRGTSAIRHHIDDVLQFLTSLDDLSKFDVFIFWGSSEYITIGLEKDLRVLQKKVNHLYTIGKGNIKHQHPSRSSKDTINFHVADLNSIKKNNRRLC